MSVRNDEDRAAHLANRANTPAELEAAFRAVRAEEAAAWRAEVAAARREAFLANEECDRIAVENSRLCDLVFAAQNARKAG